MYKIIRRSHTGRQVDKRFYESEKTFIKGLKYHLKERRTVYKITGYRLVSLSPNKWDIVLI